MFSKKFEEYKPSNFRFYGEYLAVTDKNDRTVILNRKGETVKKLKEEESVGAIYNDLFVQYDSDNGKFGLRNVNGEMVIKSKFAGLTYNGKLLVGYTTDKKPFVLNMEGEKVAKLPEGYSILFEPEFKGSDNRILVGNYDEGYKLCDADGNTIKTGTDIHDYAVAYSWGFMDSEEEEEYDEGDYEEEYVEEEVEDYKD